MISPWKSLCSFVVALGLAVSVTGCLAQVESEDEEVAVEPMSEALGVDDVDTSTAPDTTSLPDGGADGASSNPPEPPKGLCTSPSCTQL